MAVPKVVDTTIKIVLVIISPICFFLLCEAAVRLLSPQIRGWIDEDPHTFDPVLQRVFRPNASGSYYAPDGRKVTINTNSLGFRGRREYGVKDSAIYRIAGLGDSFTNGSGMNDDETYLMVLERTANDMRRSDGRRIETINMGVDTYGTIKERMFLERYGLALQPDLITIGFMPNDLWDNIGYMKLQQEDKLVQAEAKKDQISPLSPVIGLIYQLKARSHFVLWLGKKVMSVPGVYRFAYRNRPDKFDFTNPENREQIEEAYATVHEELSRIAHLADSICAESALISIPLRYQMVTGLDDIKGDIRYLDKLLSASCEELGIEFISLIDTLRSANEEGECYFPMDGHLNRRGHQVVGEYLAHWLNKIVIKQYSSE